MIPTVTSGKIPTQPHSTTSTLVILKIGLMFEGLTTKISTFVSSGHETLLQRAFGSSMWAAALQLLFHLS